MSLSITLQLGDFVFQGMEIPEELPAGVEHRLKVYEIPGQPRKIDTLGRTFPDIQWSGIFVGVQALDRVNALRKTAGAGKPLKLTWADQSYLVVISSFLPKMKLKTYVPYTITLVVQDDLANPLTAASTADLDSQLSDDVQGATTAAARVGDAGLTTSVASVQTALQTGGSMVGAGGATLNTVLTPLASAQTYVGGLIATAEGTVQGASTVGGVDAGIVASRSASALLGQASAMAQLPDLYEVQGRLARMQTNLLGQASLGRQMVVAPGVSLFDIAVTAYGDATAWADIAAANGLTDPIISTGQTIVIPPRSSGSDGVLGGT